MNVIRGMGFVSAMLAGAALSACESEAEVLGEEESLASGVAELVAPDTGPESQCGSTWDAQEVERYDGTLGVGRNFVDRHERHVGYHVGPGCTGTLISEDLFLSAGHCGYAVGDVVRFDYQNDPTGTARTPRDYSVDAVVEQENNGTWDYAIVRLGGSPGREYGHANIAAVDPAAGTQLVVIGHPARRDKEIHAGPLVDYSSTVGGNWFRHQVDTVGGNSGSGVLDLDGRLVGVHTNAGCDTTGNGNSAMRMSQLVPHSTTLTRLAQSRILWRHDNGRISLWTLDANGNHLTYSEYGPFDGWTVLGLADNKIIWKHNDGRISIWKMDHHGNHLTFVEHGPFAGWSPVNYAEDRLLWQHTDGSLSYWVVNEEGNYLSHVEHKGLAGWTAINHANNRILFRNNADGGLSLWKIDEQGNMERWSSYAPSPGWWPLGYHNGQIDWRDGSGSQSTWQLDHNDNFNWLSQGPHDGWTLLSAVDRKFLWRHWNGTVSYWTVNGEGRYLAHREFGYMPGWTPIATTGGLP